MREYRLIDADCHVVEPPHIWETWLPKAFQDRAPKLVKDEDGGDEGQTGRGKRTPEGAGHCLCNSNVYIYLLAT